MASVFTSAGRAITTARLRGVGSEPAYSAIGTGAGTAAVTDTTLSTEVEARVLGTSSQVTTSTTNDTYQVVATHTMTGTPRTITNAGLFDASSTGNMAAKADFAGVGLGASDALQLTHKLQYT